MSTFEELKSPFDEYYPLYINGQWVDGKDKGRIDVYCPANNEKVCSVAVASKEDVDKAVQAARNAFPGWCNTYLPDRYDILMQIYHRILENLNKLGKAESMESGRTLFSSMLLIKVAVEYFPYFASLIRTREDGTSSEFQGTRVLVVREPIGVVGAICPWNAPLFSTFWKLAPALAAGNCVVLKPSSYTPLGALEMMKTIGDLLPPGVFNIVNGKGSTTGQYVLDHPGIDKLSFTGSTDIGKSVGIAAAQRIIPATLELGGKSPGIYFADIREEDMPKAIENIVSNASFNAGQICAMQSRVLVEEPVYDMFVKQVTSKLKEIKIGPPWDDDAQMGPVAYKDHMESVLEYIKIGQEEGARLAYGGKRVTEGELSKGYYIEPTIFADVDNSMRIAQEEIFGPVICFIKFKDEEDAIRIANDSVYGLSGGVFSGDLAKALRVSEGVRTGNMFVNGLFPKSVGGAPFGGYKNSGIGRECYITTLDAFSQIKMIAFPY